MSRSSHHHHMAHHHHYGHHRTASPSTPAEQSIAAKSMRTQYIVAHCIVVIARLPLSLAMGKRYAPHDMVRQLELALLVMISLSVGVLVIYLFLQGINGCSSAGMSTLDQRLTARAEAIYIIVQAVLSATCIGLALGAFLTGPLACPTWVRDGFSSDPIGLWCWRQIIIAVLSLVSLTLVPSWYNVLGEMVDRFARQTGTGRRKAWRTSVRLVGDAVETPSGWDAANPRERLDLADDVWLEEERVDPFSRPGSAVGTPQTRRSIAQAAIGIPPIQQALLRGEPSGQMEAPPAYVSVAGESVPERAVSEVYHTPVVAVSAASSRRTRNK